MKKEMIILLSALLFAFTGCEDLEESSPPSPSRNRVPEQESWDSKIILSESGVVTAIIKARHVKKFKEITEIDEGLTVDFFNKDGFHSSVLTAKKGIVDERTKDLKAIGKVVLTSDEGVKLQTEELKWDNRRRKVLADGQVKISTDQDVETGTGFEADPDLKHWTMKNVIGRSKRKIEIPKE